MNNKISELEKFAMCKIPVGKQNAQHQKDIASALGITTREFRQCVHDLRLAGVPVCSSPYFGYWIPETMSELKELIGVLESYVLSHQETVNSLYDVYFENDSMEEVIENALQRLLV